MADTRPLGATSRQSAALAALSIPVLLRLGATPSQRMVDSARWGREHGVRPDRDFRLEGVRRG